MSFPAEYDLARGVPSLDLVPVELVRRALRDALGRNPDALLYGDSAGNAELRGWLGERHALPADRIVLTNGSLHALELVLKAAGLQRRPLLVEGPTYDFSLRTAARTGYETITVDRTPQGLDLDLLERMLRRHRPGIFYVIPTFQNPSGGTLTVGERRDMLELLERFDVLVLEDDPYRDLWFERAPPPPLHEAAPDRVVHLTSFTKTLAPGLRCGGAILPKWLVAPVSQLARATYIAPGALAQAAVAAYCRAGCFVPQVDVVRAELWRRCAALRSGLGASAPDAPGGGYFLWWRPDGIDDVSAVSERAGVASVPASDFYADGRSEAGVRLSFAREAPERLQEAGAALAAAAQAVTADAGAGAPLIRSANR